MADDAHPEWRSETRAIRAGRTYNDESLAPVLWPSTTYFNRSVDEQYALAPCRAPGQVLQPQRQPVRARVRGRRRRARRRRGRARVRIRHGRDLVRAVDVLLDRRSRRRAIVDVLRHQSDVHDAVPAPRHRRHVRRRHRRDAVRAAVRPGKTQLVFVETPANPGLTVVDLDAVGAIEGPFTVCDSTFAPPPVQQTLVARHRHRDARRHEGTRGTQRRDARRHRG